MQFLKIEFLKLSPNLRKNAKSFLEKMEFFPEDPRYALQTFSRQSSDYLRHSVLSPKRFGQKEMKIEQKARPPPEKSRILKGQGGTSTDLREVCARRKGNFKALPEKLFSAEMTKFFRRILKIFLISKTIST